MECIIHFFFNANYKAYYCRANYQNQKKKKREKKGKKKVGSYVLVDNIFYLHSEKKKMQDFILRVLFTQTSFIEEFRLLA